MAEPLITAEEFMEKYAHLKVELVSGRVMLSGRPVEFVGDRITCHDKSPVAPLERVLRKPPQLCVEVWSPSNTWMEIFEKTLDYLRVGVTAVLVLDPERQSASVYRDNGDQQIFRADEWPMPACGMTGTLGRVTACAE